MPETEIDLPRLFKDVRRTIACEHPGHDREISGCQIRYTEATWILKQIDHDEEAFFICLGFAAYFRSLFSASMTCPICGETGPASNQFVLLPINLPTVISER